MALQIWLPLDGDFRNLGINTNQLTNLGTVTFSTNGKIGSCASFNANTAGTSCLRLNPILNNTSQFSISFWVKLNDISKNQCIFSQRVSTNAAGFTIFYLTGSGIRFDDGASLQSSQNLATNTWYHIVCCRNNSKKYIYINGVLSIDADKNSTSASNVNSNYCLIGGSQGSAAGDTPQTNANLLNGFLNDFRIYNHCLSPKEIKQISQGLILHYPMNLANDKIMQGHNLPSEYQEVEYLESTGTQYIATAILPNVNSRIIIHCASKNDTANKCIFGANEGNTVSQGEWALWYRTPYWDYAYPTSSNTTSTYVAKTGYNYFTDYYIDYDLKNSKIKINNNIYTYSRYESYAATRPIYIFSTNRTGNGNNPSQIQLKEFIYYNNDRILNHFIPCYRKSDSKPGLYDIINNIFYTNSGTNDFLCGPIIKKLSSEYGRLEYLESSGTQLINTNVSPANTQQIDLKYAFVVNTGYQYIFGSYVNESTNAIRLITQNNSATGIYVSFNSKAGTSRTINNLTEHITDIIEGRINQNKVRLINKTTGYIYNNDSASTTLFDVAGTTTTETIKLFGRASTGSSARIYYFIIYNNNVPIRQMIPVLRLSDNKPGMYDLVNDVFYVNTGSGEFTCSSSINDIAYDTSGYCINSHINGNIIITETTPRYNSAFIFNGLTCIKNSNYNLGNIWSVSFWAKINNTNNSGWQAFYALNAAGGDTDLATNIYLNAGNLSCQFTANGQYQVVSSIGINRTNWFHYCITFDGSTVKGYIDGTQKMSKAITNAQLIRHNLVIGAKSNSSDASTVGGYFKGAMSDFRIYATALSAEDVKELYEMSMVVDASGNITPRVLT